VSESKASRDISAFPHLLDLASERVGGKALATSDDFFAGMENLLKPGRAQFDPNTYTDRGKEMDGWESRRRRSPGHDWCIVRLGLPGVIRGVDVDTDWFLGNHPPYASMDATTAPHDATPEALRAAEWTEILPSVPLAPGSRNLFPVRSSDRWTHVKLRIYPDGGVGRLRVYGEALPDLRGGEMDLAAAANGAKAVAASDSFFSPMDNLILPGRPENMGGGWETRRRRLPGNDWVIVRLAAPGTVRRLLVDTCHFKGNYPPVCAVDGLYWPDAPPNLLPQARWTPVLPESRLGPDEEHLFEGLADAGPFTHLRLRVLPCGGVARLRAWGHPAEADPSGDTLLAHLQSLDPAAAEAAFKRCCGSTRFAKAMAAARPFRSRAHLFGEAERIWWRLDDADWLEAFSHHPKIGADVAKLREKFAATATWSAGEQAGMAAADEATISALAAGNSAYDARYGFLFIVCATGLSAKEMLDRLNGRMHNRPDDEIRIAAAEQAKITRLRLEKLP